MRWKPSSARGEGDVEVVSRKSKVLSRKSEVRSQKSEVASQKAEVACEKSAVEMEESSDQRRVVGGSGGGRGSRRDARGSGGTAPLGHRHVFDPGVRSSDGRSWRGRAVAR